MKRIQKGEPLESLVDFAKRNPSANWENLDYDVKQELRETLRQEQGHICCYCERQLMESKTHIEHLKPRDRFPQETFCYENLLLSCQDNRSCGIQKHGWHSDNMVTPLDCDCEDRFIFTGNGQILPAHKDDQNARETIDRLGLNSPKLKDSRHVVYKMYQQIKETSPPDEFDGFVAETLRQNDNGEFAEFWTTIKYVAEKS